MASSVIQFRVDDELKAQASAVCDKLGIDLPTALRIFMKRTVLVNGIPFSMTLPKDEQSDLARKNGTADMTLEEINKEIAAARADIDAEQAGVEA